MRRLATITSVFVLVAAGVVTGLAAVSSAAGAEVTPGSVWTLSTPTSCESESFAMEHAFTTAVDYGNGDSGKYEGSKKLKMTWTSGTAAGEVFKGGWHKKSGVYTGTYSAAGVSVSATLAPASSSGCATVTTAPASPSIVLGATETDTATVTGADGVTPTGTLSFYVCGPDAAAVTTNACTTATGTLLGSPISATASGPGSDAGSATATATSAPFTPGATGTYCFLGVYSGDSIFPAGSDGSTTDECFAVTSAGPGVTTAPASSSIVLGTSDTDTATVTGVSDVVPTGDVTFSVCGPTGAAATCTAASGTVLGSPVSVTASGSPATATAISDSFTPTTTGTYCFVGVYSGDTNFDSASDGSATDECFAVTPATPAVSTTPGSASLALGNTNADSATVTGVDGITPTGTVDFTVCPGDTNPCSSSSSGAMDLGSVTLSGSAGTSSATSPWFTPTAAGSYCFSGSYSGDTNYASASDASLTDECFDVTATTASPLGLESPENSFGTGALSLGAGSPSNIWAAVNGYCTAKENGDEFLSAFDGTWNGDGWECSATNTPETPFATANYEYNGNDGTSAGYSYDIVTPPSAAGTTTAPITVQAYDPAYEPTQCASAPSGPFNPAGGQTPDLEAGGADTSITTSYALTYAPVPGDNADDTSVPGISGPYVAPSGDPTTCGQWATLFTIPAGSADGFYRLEVSTPQTPGQNSDGVNAYGLRVYQGASFSRCSTLSTDAWYSPSCPVISGQSALSTFVDESGSTGSFYLSQVPASDAGRVMDVNLFDPGEGDKDMKLIDPDGNAVPFTWQTTDGCPLPAPNAASTDCAQGLGFVPLSGSGTALDVSGTIASPAGQESNSEFNDREVQLSTTIPADYSADNGGWWKIEYTSTNGTVQDRITWSVVLGATPPAGTGDTGAQDLHGSSARTGRSPAAVPRTKETRQQKKDRRQFRSF